MMLHLLRGRWEMRMYDGFFCFLLAFDMGLHLEQLSECGIF